MKYDLEELGYYDILNNWKIYDRNQAIKNKKHEMIQILEGKEWGKEFKEFCKRSKYEFESNESFFSSIDNEKILNNIKRSDSQNILEFIKAVNIIGDFECISKDSKTVKKYYLKEIDDILRLKLEIEKIKNQENQKGKSYLLNELIDTLEKWIESSNQNIAQTRFEI